MMRAGACQPNPDLALLLAPSEHALQVDAELGLGQPYAGDSVGTFAVNRLGLPVKLRRSLACTNSIENMMGTVRRVCRNVKRWRNAAMALRWTAAGMMEAAKGFRRLKAYKHLPALRAALAAHQCKYTQRVEHDAEVNMGSTRWKISVTRTGDNPRDGSSRSTEAIKPP
jgi:hypothetical protein